jgi:hypothetical protein
MLRRTLMTVAAAGLIATTAQAQATTPSVETKQEKPAPPPMPPQGLPVNVRIELTITDQAGPGEATKRNISMIVADNRNGSIRSSGRVIAANRESFVVTLNVDATPRIIKDNLLRLDLALEYLPKPGSDNATSGEGRAQLNERMGLMVTSGKPIIISQASDPTSNRKISVELTATILP